MKSNFDFTRAFVKKHVYKSTNPTGLFSFSMKFSDIILQDKIEDLDRSLIFWSSVGKYIL